MEHVFIILKGNIMPVVDTYQQFGGIHPETASLTNVLAASGLKNPLTNQPFTESMLFGIGGGIGAGYILWEFQEHRHQTAVKVIVVAFQHLWQYPVRFYQNLCDRIGVTIAMPETGSRKVAADTLGQALANGRSAVVWVDPAFMPYHQLPELMKGHGIQLIGVCGTDDDGVLVDDCAAVPFRVPADVFADGRARVGSNKNRLLLVEGVEPTDVAGAVQQGLQAAVDHLSSDSDSFGLPAFRKWGKMTTDAKNKKGWLNLFNDERGLYSTLRSAFESVDPTADRNPLRGLYATFLREAADVTGNQKLLDVATKYDALQAMWLRFAEATLPDEVEPFREAKALLRERHTITMQGGDAWEKTQPLTAQLRKLSSTLNTAFPLDEAGKKALFEDLHDQLLALYDAETKALTALKEAL